MNEFKTYHPIVNFTYFAFVIVFSCFFMHPACLVISLVSGFLYSNAFNVELDSMGRVLIPAALREYAQLETEAQIIGMDTNLEIWNTELWNNENESTTSESVAQIMEELNF